MNKQTQQTQQTQQKNNDENTNIKQKPIWRSIVKYEGRREMKDSKLTSGSDFHGLIRAETSRSLTNYTNGRFHCLLSEYLLIINITIN